MGNTTRRGDEMATTAQMLAAQLEMVAELAQRAAKDLAHYSTVGSQSGQDIATAKNIMDAVAKTAKQMAQ